MDAETQRSLGQNLANITGQGYNAAFDKAATQFNADQARKIQEAQYGADYGLKGLTAATSANQAAGNIGAQQAQYGLQNLTALATAGNTQQAQRQASLNALYNQYLDQRNYPTTMLKNQADLIKNLGGNAVSDYGAKPSDLQSLTGAAEGVTQLVKDLTSAGKSAADITAILKGLKIDPTTLKPTQEFIDEYNKKQTEAQNIIRSYGDSNQTTQGGGYEPTIYNYDPGTEAGLDFNTIPNSAGNNYEVNVDDLYE